MTAANFARALKLVGLSEGGYTDDERDKGNWHEGALIGTNRGISAPVLARWLGRAPSPREMRNLSKTVADAIYKARYWDAVRGDDLPGGVDYAVFDYGVNSGARRAIKGLQIAIGEIADGVIGGMTLRAVGRSLPEEIINLISVRRLSFLQRIPGPGGWIAYGPGWARRVHRVREDAIKMAMEK